MKLRWTTKELKKSDDEVLGGLVLERRSDLNPFTPLATRLSEIYSNLKKKIEEAQKDNPACYCDDCGYEFVQGESILPIRDIYKRVDPGGEMPVGECPKCRALGYLKK